VIGTVIDGTYRIVDRLGSGAMGEVYLVEHVRLGRREAIKVLLPELAADPMLVARFRREARAINRLRHPNIVGIYDFGQLPDGRLYLTMEYAAGVDLWTVQEKLPGRRMEIPRAMHLVHQLCGAIEHAHGHGVVHRDLKPPNLMVVDDQGQECLKILDFGVAKVLDPEGRGDELTRKGEVFGTPEYLAPERLQGGPDDPRSDLYSIGCILFELIAGAAPYTGSYAFVLVAHMTNPIPRLGSIVPNVPTQLEAIVAGLLAKSPGERFQSGGHVQAALEQVPGFPRKFSWTGAALAPTDRTVMAGPALPTPTVRDVREQLCDAMVQLAEEAVAQTPADRHLAAVLEHARMVRLERGRVTAARIDLDAQHTQTVQAAREREGSLRFAIADLRFDRARAVDPMAAGDVDFQIDALSIRVQEVGTSVQRTLLALEEQRSRLVAFEHQIEPRWLDAHRQLRAALGHRIGGLAATIDRFL
jgi:hypothetical protein